MGSIGPGFCEKRCNLALMSLTLYHIYLTSYSLGSERYKKRFQTHCACLSLMIREKSGDLAISSL